MSKINVFLITIPELGLTLDVFSVINIYVIVKDQLLWWRSIAIDFNEAQGMTKTGEQSQLI
ncbi:MAG: hypothetical protein DRH15_08205 [Deltaproteobacteria bacterium]|nr:MAG: hypothetical protein DRH15_08205 [Deltaproteobacteria bacterium]